MGPIQVMVVAFEDDKFDGSIVPELSRLIENKIVRIVDLVLLRKDDNGGIDVMEIEDLDPTHEAAQLFHVLEGEVGGLLSDEDLVAVADGLPVGTAAAFVVWEDLWAADLHAAAQANGAHTVFHEVIPAERAEAALAALTEGA